MAKQEKEARIIGSAQKCLQILSYMATVNEELSILDLAKSLDLNKSTMHHYLATLTGEKYLLQNPENRKYRIGPEAFRVGESYLRKDLPYQDVEGILKELCDEIGFNVYFYIRSGDKVTCVLSRQATRLPYDRNSAGIGTSLPLHASAAGKIFLAWLPEDERERTLAKTGLNAYTKKTITNPELLNKELTEIRLLGYAVNDQEYDEEVSLSVPVFGFGDKVVGAISLASEPTRLTDKQIKRLMRPLVKYGQLLSETVHNVII